MVAWLNPLKLLFSVPKSPIESLQTFAEFGRTSRCWWGTFQVEAGQSRFWRVGNVVICVDRFSSEWHVASAFVDKLDVPLEDDQENSDPLIAAQNLNFTTFTFRTQAEIRLKPILADRPLASTLAHPLYIPADEEILLYVSSPVWVRVETGTSSIVLDDVPTTVLSNTWFGTNTREGQLCYAGQTHCSPHLKDLPCGPDRIISPMLIKNCSKRLLKLEQLSVPLPYLSVYADPDNFLWTEQLYVYREGDENPQVQVAKGPPKSLSEANCLTSARRESHASLGLKSFFNTHIWD